MEIKDIKSPADIKKLTFKELEKLSSDIREFLLDNISKTGGHLSSNLGDVELIVGMHYVFNSPKDKFIFDVGHQCYTHKVLTGRANEFTTLRKYNGLSGFISKKESVHDVWESGHSSTSLSAACGFLMASDNSSNSNVVTLIGDSSLTNGVSLEALNFMGSIKNLNPIIILNDNKMSISKSVGATSRYLSKLRSLKTYRRINSFFARHSSTPVRRFFHIIKTGIKNIVYGHNIFESWGYDYIGPYDGNDISLVIKTLNSAKSLNKPVVLHFVTKKGKGYSFAENDEEGKFHGIGPFDLETGETIKKDNANPSYSLIMANKLEQDLLKEPSYVLTPAMLKGSCLDKLNKQFPQSVIDCGIAEEHAAVLASSLAQNGKNVYLMLYSTFAQRAYDFILNDICRVNAKVTICLDRCDIVPEDGPTHQGIYDVNMFGSMPNIIVSQPRNGNELNALIDFSKTQDRPFVIRYPKGTSTVDDNIDPITSLTWEKLKEGNDINIITYGENIDYVISALENTDISYGLYNARFIKPIDKEMAKAIIAEEKPILIYENVVGGAFEKQILDCANEIDKHPLIISMNFSSEDIIPHGDVENIRKQFKLSKEDILNKVKLMIK